MTPPNPVWQMSQVLLFLFIEGFPYEELLENVKTSCNLFTIEDDRSLEEKVNEWDVRDLNWRLISSNMYFNHNRKIYTIDR